jgi:hypothetical protein
LYRWFIVGSHADLSDIAKKPRARSRNVPANTTEMMTSVRSSEDISDAEVLLEMIAFAERLLPESRESFASIAPIANYLRDEAAAFEGVAIGFPSPFWRCSAKEPGSGKVVQ